MEPNVLSRRIEQLAELAGDEPDAAGNGTAVASLRGEIAGLRADLGALRGEVGSVRTDIDGLAGRITGSVAANRTETGTLSSRVADLVNRVEVVGVRLDEVKSDLPLLVREVRDGLELVPVRTGAKFDELTGKLGESVGTRVDAVAGEVRRTVAAALEREADNAAATRGLMSEARSALESRLAVVEDALDALSERLEALLRDGAHTTRDQLREMAGSLTGLEQRVDAVSGEQVERIVARLRDVTEHRLDNLSTVLGEAIRSRNEQLRRELLEVLTRGASEQELTRNQVAVLVDAVRHAGAEQVAASNALIAGTAASLAEVREEIQTELDDVAERLLVTVADLPAQQDVRAAAQEARSDALKASLEGGIEAVHAQVATAMEATRVDVAAEVSALRRRLEEVVAGTLALAHTEAANRAELQHALETVRERVALSVSASTESVRATFDDLINRVGDATRSTHATLLDRLGEHHATVTGRLAEAAAATAGSTAASRDAGQRLAALTRSQEETRRSVEGLQGDWPSRVDQAAAAARVTAEAAVTGLRAEVRVQLDVVIAEVARAVAGVGAAKAKLDVAAEQVVEQVALQRTEVAQAVATSATALALTQERLERSAEQLTGSSDHVEELAVVEQPRPAPAVDAAVRPARKAAPRKQVEAGASDEAEPASKTRRASAPKAAVWPDTTKAHASTSDTPKSDTPKSGETSSDTATSDRVTASSEKVGVAKAAAPTGEDSSGSQVPGAQKAAPRQPAQAKPAQAKAVVESSLPGRASLENPGVSSEASDHASPNRASRDKGSPDKGAAPATTAPEAEPPVPARGEPTPCSGERASGKPAVLEAMPEVPSPAAALEATFAPTRPVSRDEPSLPTQPGRPGPAPSTSSRRPGSEELRRIFRRRKP